MQIPLPWKLAEAGQLDLDVACTLQQGRNKDSMAAQEVDTNMDAGVRFRLSHVPDWKARAADNSFLPLCSHVPCPARSLASPIQSHQPLPLPLCQHLDSPRLRQLLVARNAF